MSTTQFTTQRPFNVEVNFIPRQQKTGEDRRKYLRDAANYARRTYNKLRCDPDYYHAHESFAVRDALSITEAQFTDLGTFGVEHIDKGSGDNSPAIEHLNNGDSCGLTIMVIRGRFVIGAWGDIVERGDYN